MTPQLAWRPSVPVLGTPEVQLDRDLPKGFDPDDLDDQMFEGREGVDPACEDCRACYPAAPDHSKCEFGGGANG